MEARDRENGNQPQSNPSTYLLATHFENEPAQALEESIGHNKASFTQLITGMAVERTNQPVPAMDESIEYNFAQMMTILNLQDSPCKFDPQPMDESIEMSKHDQHGMMSMATIPTTPNWPISATTPPTMPNIGSKSQARPNGGQPEELQPICLGPSHCI
jgi:hypothetical protein